MQMYMDNNLDLPEERIIQEKFWFNLSKRYKVKSQNTIICPSFFKKNSDILNN